MQVKTQSLSPPLKALIAAPFARPNFLAHSPRSRSVFERIRQEARSKNVGEDSWLALSTASTITMNSALSLAELYHLATENTKKLADRVYAAELMREVGLKCIGFNGVPRTINCLGEFRASLPKEVVSELSTERTRWPTKSNIEETTSLGWKLWKSVYFPHDRKLYDKLADSHPDLPAFIVAHEYGALFADPERHDKDLSSVIRHAKVGRVLTSLVAIACLRAQTGVGPQVTSHVLGLRKALEDGNWMKEGSEMAKEGRFGGEDGKWLASDEGSIWVLESVDAIVEALGEGQGSSFAPGLADGLAHPPSQKSWPRARPLEKLSKL